MSVLGVVVRSMLIAFKMLSLEDIISSVIAEFVKYSRESTRGTSLNQSELGLHSST